MDLKEITKFFFFKILPNICIGLMVIILLMIYLEYPAEKRAFEECNNKILCEQGMLKGKICDVYNRNLKIFGNISNMP